jgi:hypothetical protein
VVPPNAAKKHVGRAGAKSGNARCGILPGARPMVTGLADFADGFDRSVRASARVISETAGVSLSCANIGML